MLKENMYVGMKVTTTGKPENGRERVNSETCNAEEEFGYSLVKIIGIETVLVGSKCLNWHTRFKYEQIHPYWGGK